MAILTLIINGTTCGLLVSWLGLATPSQGKTCILGYVRDKIFWDTHEAYQKMLATGEFPGHQASLVTKWCTVMRREDFGPPSKAPLLEARQSPAEGQVQGKGRDETASLGQVEQEENTVSTQLESGVEEEIGAAIGVNDAAMGEKEEGAERPDGAGKCWQMLVNAGKCW